MLLPLSAAVSNAPAPFFENQQSLAAAVLLILSAVE
jgi:hypothetical protein